MTTDHAIRRGINLGDLKKKIKAQGDTLPLLAKPEIPGELFRSSKIAKPNLPAEKVAPVLVKTVNGAGVKKGNALDLAKEEIPVREDIPGELYRIKDFRDPRAVIAKRAESVGKTFISDGIPESLNPILEYLKNRNAVAESRSGYAKPEAIEENIRARILKEQEESERLERDRKEREKIGRLIGKMKDARREKREEDEKNWVDTNEIAQKKLDKRREKIQVAEKADEAKNAERIASDLRVQEKERKEKEVKEARLKAEREKRDAEEERLKAEREAEAKLQDRVKRAFEAMRRGELTRDGLKGLVYNPETLLLNNETPPVDEIIPKSEQTEVAKDTVQPLVSNTNDIKSIDETTKKNTGLNRSLMRKVRISKE